MTGRSVPFDRDRAPTDPLLSVAAGVAGMDVYGLIGNPVGHSLSPPMHEAGYEALGLDARYVTFEPDADGRRE